MQLHDNNTNAKTWFVDINGKSLVNLWLYFAIIEYKIHPIKLPGNKYKKININISTIKNNLIFRKKIYH
jgi:hypothetical protein